LVVMMVEKLAV